MRIEINFKKRKILEEKYNGILLKYPDDVDPNILHFEFMKLFFPEIIKNSSVSFKTFLLKLS